MFASAGTHLIAVIHRRIVLYIPILLGIYYGLRRGNTIGLQWSGVDFDTNQIRIDHKAYVMSEIEKGS